jgi:hypothetical protein
VELVNTHMTYDHSMFERMENGEREKEKENREEEEE